MPAATCCCHSPPPPSDGGADIPPRTVTPARSATRPARRCYPERECLCSQPLQTRNSCNHAPQHGGLSPARPGLKIPGSRVDIVDHRCDALDGARNLPHASIPDLTASCSGAEGGTFFPTRSSLMAPSITPPVVPDITSAHAEDEPVGRLVSPSRSATDGRARPGEWTQPELVARRNTVIGTPSRRSRPAPFRPARHAAPVPPTGLTTPSGSHAEAERALREFGEPNALTRGSTGSWYERSPPCDRDCRRCCACPMFRPSLERMSQIALPHRRSRPDTAGVRPIDAPAAFDPRALLLRHFPARCRGGARLAHRNDEVAINRAHAALRAALAADASVPFIPNGRTA